MNPNLFENTRIYIPAEVRLALAQKTNLPERAWGAALFADISGFTPLTEALTRALGLRRGAEELPIYLNRAYDALISQVDRFGGSVIGFAGDAITCWFDDAPIGFDRPVPPGAERAAYCALALQSVPQAFGAIPVPGQNPVALALKVAVAAGPVQRYLVGDPATQTIELIAGSTVMRMAAGEHLAAKGETIFDAATVRTLGERLSVKEWRSEAGGANETELFGVVGSLAGEPGECCWPEPGAAELPIETIAPWVHPPIYERLAQGLGDFLTELRPATAVFLRFGGIDYDHDPAAGKQLDACIRWAQGVLNQHEAILTHPTIGDKGSFLCISFGAPTAHDNDPQRAAAAALELLNPPAELAFLTPPQIGISQGTARTGSYGGATRRTYDILGDQVNLAARLMMAAKPGEILVSQRIQQQISDDFELAELAPISVKGKSQPVAIAQLLGRRPGGGIQALSAQANPLVGRAPEAARLDEILGRALAGEGQIVHIVGPAGIGKSRLAADFAAQAGRGGLRLLAGACQSTSQTLPYQAWQSVFRSLLNLPAHLPDPEAFLEIALRDRNPQWGERTPLLGALLGLSLPDNPTTAALDSRLRYEATQTLAVDLLTSYTLEQPVLLVLDDIHWMDEAGRDLTKAVGRITSELACTFFLLERVGEESFGELARLPAYTRLELAPLEPEAVAGIVANRLGGPAAPLVSAVVYSQSQGNPYFVEQLIRVMEESGCLVQEEARWGFNATVINALRDANSIQQNLDTQEWEVMPGASIPTTAIGVPDSVQGVMLARIDRLPEPQKLTLRTASVIGREFDLGLLELAHPAFPGRQTLQAQLSLLEQGEFVVAEAASVAEGRYAFAHNALQEVLYNVLPNSLQQELHQRAGAALETVAPEAIPQLAYHYARSGERAKTLHYLDLAAGQAKANYANATALNAYRQALVLEERWQWRKGQAEVLHLLGVRDEEKTAIEAMQNLADAPENEVVRLYFDFHFEIAEYPAAIVDAGRLRTLAQEAGDWLGEADSLRQLGLVARKQGDNQAALTYYQQAKALFEAQPDRTKSAEAARAALLNNYGFLLYRMSQYEPAEAVLQEALAAARREHLARLEVDDLNALGSNTLVQEKLQSARSYFEAARERAMAVGDRKNQAVTLLNLAMAEHQAKNYSSAQSLLAAALHIHQTVGDRWNEISTLNNLGVLCQETGQHEQAYQAFQGALALSREIGDEEGVMYLMLNQGQVKRDLGELAAAHSLFEDGLSLAEKQQNVFVKTYFLSHQAILNLMKGNYAAAVQLATSALTMRTELGLDTLISDNLAVLALASARLDQPDRAEAWAERAIQILAAAGGEGLENPVQDYWLVCQAFSAIGQEEKARAALASALQLIQQSASRIVEPEIRQTYMNNIPACRQVLEEARRLELTSPTGFLS